MGRGPLALRRAGAVCATVLAAVVLVDQASKTAVRALVLPMSSISLIGRALRITYVRNTGAAFGMLPGYRPMFVAISLFVLAFIAGYWWRHRPTHPLVVVALGLVCGGAIGNLIDRVIIGRVTDFIELPAFPVFNVADSAIVVGVAMLVYWLLFGPVESPAHVASGDGERDDGPVAVDDAPGEVSEDTPGVR